MNKKLQKENVWKYLILAVWATTTLIIGSVLASRQGMPLFNIQNAIRGPWQFIHSFAQTIGTLTAVLMMSLLPAYILYIIFKKDNSNMFVISIIINLILIWVLNYSAGY